MIGQGEASLSYVRFVTHIESVWGYAKWSRPLSIAPGLLRKFKATDRVQ